MTEPDVVLVQMPFAGLPRPSLALGLLAAQLRHVSLSVDVVYANVAFAEDVGLAAYFLVGEAAPHHLLGDWVFARSAFGDVADGRPGPAADESLLPLAPRLIAEVLRAAGHPDVPSLLADIRHRATLFVADLAAEIVARRPHIVACTSMFDQHVASLSLLQELKRLDTSIMTVIGGPNCAGPMGLATHRAFPAVDFTVTGESDDYAARFFQDLRDAGSPRAVASLPPGVLGPAARDGGDLPPCGPLPLVQDLDATPIPDYDDYFEQVYSSAVAPYLSIGLPFETSRGCWWGARHHCTFCGLNAEGMAFRKKSPHRALAEIRTLTARHGVSQGFATDNIIDMSYFRTVLPGLASDEREYRLFYETKANLSREQVQVLSEAGCHRIQPGIESLHDETLEIMRKGTTACTNIQLLKHCLEFGVAPSWSILCNFPASEPAWVADVARDFEALHHLPPPHGVTPIRFDRFSPYQQRPTDYGLQLRPAAAYRRIYPLPDDLVGDIAYFFEDERGIPPETWRHIDAANRAVRRWENAFSRPSVPRLIIDADDGHRLIVRDTRSPAPRTHELTGGIAAVLRALDVPASRGGLAARLNATGEPIGEEELGGLLDELLAARLIWRSSRQYIALPTREPRRPLWSGRPLGRIDIGRYLRDSRPLGGS